MGKSQAFQPLAFTDLLLVGIPHEKCVTQASAPDGDGLQLTLSRCQAHSTTGACRRRAIISSVDHPGRNTDQRKLVLIVGLHSLN
jgi:hypothetical protein